MRTENTNKQIAKSSKFKRKPEIPMGINKVSLSKYYLRSENQYPVNIKKDKNC